MAEEDLSGGGAGDATAAIAEIDAAIAAGAGAGATGTEKAATEPEAKVEPPEPPALRLANAKARAVAQREEKLASTERELTTAREKFEAERTKFASEVEFASKVRTLAEDDVVGLLELVGLSPAKVAAALSGAPQQQKTPKEIAELRAEIERLKQGKEAETEEVKKAVTQQEEKVFLSTISADKYPEVALYLQTRGDKALLENAYALTEKLKREGRKGDWTNEELLSLLEQGAKKLHDQVRGASAKPPPAPARNALTGSAATASTGGTREMTDEERTELAVAEVNRIRKAGK